MSKVLKEFRINKYCVMVLDSIPNKAYNKYLIQGIEYEPVDVYDTVNTIAIVSDKSFVGMEVEFK